MIQSLEKMFFVGSATQLVALVTIEDDVTIATGSTITENVQSGHLSINHTK